MKTPLTILLVALVLALSLSLTPVSLPTTKFPDRAAFDRSIQKPRFDHTSCFRKQLFASVDDRQESGRDTPLSGVHRRREIFKMSSLMIAYTFGFGIFPAESIEGKVYSSNARNMMRLSNGDSSGGSIYDNNPSSPKARLRRAMVGCKNSSARSLAGESIGSRNLSEKECNMKVMGTDGPDFMLDALVELDCPTCPYGIGNRR